MALPLIGGGMTPANFYNLLNDSMRVVNILDYGAIGNNSTDNTTAIQNAINDVHATTCGVVYIPEGIFKSHTLTLYSNVALLGKSKWFSVIRSISAEPLINLQTTGTWVYSEGINHLCLDGNNIGTIGFNTKKYNNFFNTDLYIINFTTYGIYLLGGLVGQFSNTIVSGCGVGVYGIVDQNDLPSSFPNLVSFHRCNFYSCTTQGICWLNGSSLEINRCDFEFNTSVGIYFAGTGPAGTWSKGLIINNSWFEANSGVDVAIGESGGTSEFSHSITDTLFVDSSLTTTIQIVASNNNTDLILRGCITNNSDDITIIGNKAKVTNDQSRIKGTITGTGYYNITPSLVQ